MYMDRGLTVPASWVRDQEGVPDPVDGEPVVGKVQPALATPADV